MIKTLRIISIVVAVFAVFLLVFLAVKSFWSGKETSKTSESVSVVDKFRKNRGAGDKTEDGQSTPLVAEAQKFSLYLNPPVAPQPVEVPGTPGPVVPMEAPKPENVVSRFNLIGTCYLPTEPNSSLALIDEVGKGLRWVRQSSIVGHSLIQAVKDGSITVKEGDKVTEMEVPKEQKPSLLKGEGPSKSVSSSSAGSPAVSLVDTQANPQESIAALETVMKQVQTMQGQGAESQKIGSPASVRDSRNIRKPLPVNQGAQPKERESQGISNPSGDSNSIQAEPNKDSKVSRSPVNRRPTIRRPRLTPPTRGVNKDANSANK